PVRCFTAMLTTFLIILLIISPALALLEVQDVTPDSTEESGMTVKFKRSKEGAYTFTVTRYLKAEALSWPNSQPSDLIVENMVELEIRKGDKLFGKMRLAPQKQKENSKDKIVYVFDLARECIRDSRLSIWENVRHKDDTRPHRLGGSLFQLNFAEIDLRIQASIPQHP
ncbi:MAG TPA: hypothetical protein VGB77_07000, partial [Abditibacteriaceae bacterium]